MKISGAEIVADFISRFLHNQVFLVTGGACAFMVDAIGENPTIEYVPFQHEQAAAMAADAIWRTNSEVGVTMSTSGPGATNLITGIACSWFDSIPSFHITGQVNESESAKSLGVKVRQAGFQETDIVDMVKSITKFAKSVSSARDLAQALLEGYKIATTGRRGPVLIDVPMNVQKEEIPVEIWLQNLADFIPTEINPVNPNYDLSELLSDSERPLVLMGGGLVAGGKIREVQKWCQNNGVPFVSSWSAMPFLNREHELYLGSIGVYGSRIANWAVQACDLFVSFGSRLDNRQRTANPKGFAPFAKKIAFDLDSEELRKLGPSYNCIKFDLSRVENLLGKSSSLNLISWQEKINQVRETVSEGMEEACQSNFLNPYKAVRLAQQLLDDDAIVVSDCGANLCWVYQAFKPSNQLLFTAAGNSPMGYSLPAAIGASLANPDRQVACFIGDGGLQMNMQELQTIRNFKLPIKIFIQNNFGYGIIKQFQDAYFQGRHHASGYGYSVPSFEKLAFAYDIDYHQCSSEDEIKGLEIDSKKTQMFDLILPQDALITPKVEMDRFIHDQFPYQGNPGIEYLPFEYPKHPSQLD